MRQTPVFGAAYRRKKRGVQPMQEQTQLQPIPVKIYRTHDHLTVAAPMPGLEPEDILVEVTENGQLILHGDMRAALKDEKRCSSMNGMWEGTTVNSSSQ